MRAFAILGPKKNIAAEDELWGAPRGSKVVEVDIAFPVTEAPQKESALKKHK